jgi:CheY-like chemotaxis protein
VPNGEDALSALDRDRYDVVLLDEMMPGLGGLATLDAIQDRALPVPVIMVTKSEEESLMNEALGRHITDYLIKPVNPSQVFLACKRVLDSQKLQETQRSRDYVAEMQRWQTMDSRTLDAAGWTELAVELARWDVRFDRVPEAGLQQAHGDLRRGFNIEFGRFIEEHYPQWVRTEDRPMLSNDVVGRVVAPQLRDNRRVVFIIVDCMRLDQWFAIEPLLEDEFDIRRDYYYSVLPTATPYSRNAIFAGLLPADIWKQHPNYWQETSEEERTKNKFERELLELQLGRLGLGGRPTKYVKIYDTEDAVATRRQIHSFKDLSLVALVFNFIDILAHGRSENDILKELAPDEAGFRSVMKAWFARSALYEILRLLAQQDVTVVISTDHGAVLSRRAALVHANRDTSTNLRYKYGLNLNCDPKQAVIIRKPMDFMLPDDGVNKNYLLAREDFFFVYPTRFHEYERQFRGTFQHGGISIEEMILPVLTLTPRRG